MTKVGRLIFEDGVIEGEKRGEERGKEEERIIAVINLLKLNIPEQQILEMYSEEYLKATKKIKNQGEYNGQSGKMD